MNNIHILVIDDDPFEFEIYNHYLGDYCKVSHQTKLDKALITKLDSKPDLVICNATSEYSREVCEYIKGELNIPCLFTSTFKKDEERRKILKERSDVYLTKPFSEEELHATLKQIINCPVAA